ncbi:hypothetical protein HPP92_027676 [Vanilla planifolia]|uniref:Rab-GAP TBC domain-containing protein n=2 Tax=Vanilla planifolia TaxID=51239 RepID=A0A835P936_VANPL|nr:hypothetical protein HPP92_027676 [Vanilla planifolia]
MTGDTAELPLPDSCSFGRSPYGGSRFLNFRGVRWRINLGILPSSPSASVEDIRRAAANSRRSYASLRRRLIMNSYTMKDGRKSPDLTLDNPLSENPESTWGRFFRSAELEKMVDQDLSRLYPGDGTYFQTHACQTMLRRILLLWCLGHPDCGYRQGTHELLAPLVYVLHVDLDGLSKVTKAESWGFGTNCDESHLVNEPYVSSLDDLDPETRDVFLLSDAYGAEGELGVVISERFMEHDAYSMFDGLMCGGRERFAMTDFFSSSPAVGSNMGIPAVIEASSALYQLLAIIDSSLHSHLVEIGVEPQYFALRWLRVLFGREFSLNDLLLVWDELFSSTNGSYIEDDKEHSVKVLYSSLGSFISAMAVSMLLHMRSSLLATENATSCLQRLLNFPRNIDVKKLIEKARYCEELAWETNLSSPREISKQNSSSGGSRPPSTVSLKTSFRTLSDSYWEEKWRVLHREETRQKSELNKEGKIKELFGKKLGLARTESDPFPRKSVIEKKPLWSSARRRLFVDQDSECHANSVQHSLSAKKCSYLNADSSKCFPEEPTDQNITKTTECTTAEAYTGVENSLALFMATSHSPARNDTEIESEKSSITSNSFSGNEEEDKNCAKEECISDHSLSRKEDSISASTKSEPRVDGEVKGLQEVNDKKSLSSKFQLFWKFGRGGSTERNSEKGPNVKAQIVNETIGTSAPNYDLCGDNVRTEGGEKKVITTLKYIGQSILENIQVIESVFQQDRGQAGNLLVGKRHATAIAALTELRKISNLLSEM